MEEKQIELKDEAADLAPFDPAKKKKKKKVVIQDPAEDSVEELVEKTDSLSVSESLEPSFTGLKKKKKKQVQTDLMDDEKDTDCPTGEDENGEGSDSQQQKLPWEGTDRDYTYEELLDRVFHTIRENNPELAGDRRRTVMRPPQVLREGTKKTVFVNFMDLCKTMHRQPDHVMTFLLAELGTSGSLDGQQRLVVKGRLHPKTLKGFCGDMSMSMLSAMVARARIQTLKRRTVCPSSSARSVVLGELLLKSRPGSWLAWAVERLEQAKLYWEVMLDASNVV